ncbi:MAG: MFS transporter, partial [Alphaproteobacteria bacterium]
FGLINTAVFSWFTLLGNGQRWGWDSDAIWMLGALSLLSGIAFVFSQKRPTASLLDLSLFGNSRFVTALVISFLFGFGNFASVYAFPIFGQIVQNFSPTVAGSMLLPGSLFAAAVLPLTGRVADKVPPTFVMIFGLGIIAISAITLAGADSNTVFWYIAIALLLGRLGSAFVSPALNTTAIGALSPAQMRRGAGVANLALMLGGSTGISCFVVLLEQRTQFHATNLGATQTTANSATLEMLNAINGRLASGGLDAATQQGLAMNYLDQVIIAQANILGFQDGFVALSVVAVIPLIPVLLLLRKKR